jgi:hypothetical protein
MRLLLYGLQASGASAAAMLAAQRPGCLALVDVPSYALTPDFGAGRDALAKAVVNTTHDLAAHRAGFRPDAVAFVLRDPLAHWASASVKGFRDRDGALADKVAAFDALVGDLDRHADLVVRHEDLLERDPAIPAGFARLGWELPADAWELPRGINAILGDLHEAEPELFARFDHGFGEARPASGIGLAGVRDRPPLTAEQRAGVLALCPNLAALYGYAG